MTPIGVQLYSLREAAKEDFLGVLRQIADIGYKGVEPAGLHGNDPADVRKALDDLGLVAASTHGPLATSENVGAVAETAHALGYELVVSGWKREDWQTLDGVKRAAEAYQEAVELLRPHGLRMGYHNHWWEFDTVDGRIAWEVFMELAPDAFAQLDAYWAANFGKIDVPDLLARYKARVPTLHIKDGPLVQGEGHTAVGAGKMDVPAVIGAADGDVLRWLIVEIDRCEGDMLEALRASYDYLTGRGLAEGNR
jgi:sugar phosphate isomerase/epimerase